MVLANSVSSCSSCYCCCYSCEFAINACVPVLYCKTLINDKFTLSLCLKLSFIYKYIYNAIKTYYSCMSKLFTHLYTCLLAHSVFVHTLACLACDARVLCVLCLTLMIKVFIIRLGDMKAV